MLKRSIRWRGYVRKPRHPVVLRPDTGGHHMPREWALCRRSLREWTPFHIVRL